MEGKGVVGSIVNVVKVVVGCFIGMIVNYYNGLGYEIIGYDYFYYGIGLGYIEEEFVCLWNCIVVIGESEVYVFNFNIKDLVSCRCFWCDLWWLMLSILYLLIVGSEVMIFVGFIIINFVCSLRSLRLGCKLFRNILRWRLLRRLIWWRRFVMMSELLLFLKLELLWMRLSVLIVCLLWERFLRWGLSKCIELLWRSGKWLIWCLLWNMLICLVLSKFCEWLLKRWWSELLCLLWWKFLLFVWLRC